MYPESEVWQQSSVLHLLLGVDERKSNSQHLLAAACLSLVFSIERSEREGCGSVSGTQTEPVVGVSDLSCPLLLTSSEMGQLQ